MANNLFAPPTKEEKDAVKSQDLMAPPTKEELGVVLNQTEIEDFRSPFEKKVDELVQPGIKAAGESIVELMNLYDENVAAPVRKFTTEVVTGKDLEEAPSGKQQAAMMGVSETPFGEMMDLKKGSIPRKVMDVASPAGVVGFGLEIAQDPATYATLGASAVTKGARKAKDLISSGSSSARNTMKQGGLAEDVAEALLDANPQLGIVGKDKNVFAAWPKPLEEMAIPDAFNRMREIEGTVPDLQFTPQSIHYELMRRSKAGSRDLKAKLESLDPKSAKVFQDYNMSMTKEAEAKIVDTVNNLTGRPVLSPVQQGDDFINTVREKYQNERQTLAPIFQDLREMTQPLNQDETKDLAVAILENSRNLGGLASIDEAGRVILKENKPRSGVSNEEYRVLKQVIDDLNDGASFEEIQKMRDFMRKSVDPMNPGGFGAINDARKVMLDYLEGMANEMTSNNPASNGVRQVFTAFAKNERNKEAIEKIIGGSIDSIDKIYAANPDKVVGKILSNPKHTEVVAEYVGPEKMQDMISSYVRSGIDSATHSTRGFQPHTFQNWLKRNSNILQRNLPPEYLERLNALADQAWLGRRFMDEANPSGTASALKQMFDVGKYTDAISRGGLSGAMSVPLEAIRSSAPTRANRKEINQIMRQVKPSPLPPRSSIERARQLDAQRKAQKQMMNPE